MHMTRYKPSIDLVREFHEIYGHPVAKKLTVNTVKHRRLRVKLIASELAELCQALGVSLEMEVKPYLSGDKSEVMNGMAQRLWVSPEALCYSDDKVDLVETADALADLDYVVQGSNLVFGVPAGLVMKEVHRSNLSKLGNDGKPILDEDGKVVKGPNFFQPDLKKLLAEFDPEAEL